MPTAAGKTAWTLNSRYLCQLKAANKTLKKSQQKRVFVSCKYTSWDGSHQLLIHLGDLKAHRGFVKLKPKVPPLRHLSDTSCSHSMVVSDCRMDCALELRWNCIICSDPFLEVKLLLKRCWVLLRWQFRHMLLHFLFNSPWTWGHRNKEPFLI